MELACFWFPSCTKTIYMTEINEDNALKAYLSNEAVNARFSFTPAEMDLMCLIILKTQPNKPWTDGVTFYTNELIRLKKQSSNGIYSSVREALTGLCTKAYKIFDREKSKFFVGTFISTGEYQENTGKITITMSQHMHSMVINVRKEFTAFNIQSLLYMKRIYSKRLYLFCCQFATTTQQRSVTMDYLRKTFQIEDKYPLYADFDRYVLQPAISEINSSTELKIKVRTVRTGRAVDSLDITIQAAEQEASPVAPEYATLMAKLRSYGVAEWLIHNVVHTLSVQDINKCIYNMQTAKKPVSNPGKYLWKTFENMGVPVGGKMIPQQMRIDDEEQSAILALRARLNDSDRL